MSPFHQRILAEDLVRVRRPDDRERYAAAQRQARIDPNPHQIDAVIFALRRLNEGGCILADEVGLGKTIEAGLVIAQRRAEGAQRVLLIVPKSLLGQWQGELLDLFGIPSSEADAGFSNPGVYLVGREFAGGERGSALLGTAPPFDLAVIDEAHEIFAGLHRRFGPDGVYDEISDQALMAHRVHQLLRGTPVLLLTATPMQNSLAELWGLVQYVEPTGTLLGDLPTFRQVFCDDDDKTLVLGQEHELQRRLAMVLQRTLRRQAQEFLDRPFTQRRCRLYEYKMSGPERSLYDDVTDYLMEPSLHAFAGSQRRFLLLSFHRLMASSIRALAASLEKVAARLRGLQRGEPYDETVFNLFRDLEDEAEVEQEPPEPLEPVESATVAAELMRVESFIARARLLPDDAKAQRFQEAIKVILDLGRKGQGSGKAVVFTESITTQNYLRPVPDREATHGEVVNARATAEQLQSVLSAIERDIQRAHGALEQTGGAVARERLVEAKEAFEHAERQERDVEAEYEAWKLLLEQMKEADAAQASNLGQSLVPAIAEGFHNLTRQRYESVRLDPQLETEGVVVAGALRSVSYLSVGTREQLSTLFRLSLAEYLSTAIVLDDQLV